MRRGLNGGKWANLKIICLPYILQNLEYNCNVWKVKNRMLALNIWHLLLQLYIIMSKKVIFIRLYKDIIDFPWSLLESSVNVTIIFLSTLCRGEG